MNAAQTAALEPLGAGPLEVQLLTEEELCTIQGGIAWKVALGLAGAGLGAAAVGVVAGVVLYYLIT